jgi:hypothetical protein
MDSMRYSPEFRLDTFLTIYDVCSAQVRGTNQVCCSAIENLVSWGLLDQWYCHCFIQQTLGQDTL